MVESGDNESQMMSYPLGHLPSVGVVVVELQHDDGHHHRHPHDHHGGGKVLG